MATGDGLTDFNDLFKQTYADAMEDILPDGVSFLYRMADWNGDYSELSKETLEYRVNRYEDSKAKKELKKRELPLWKVLNDPK